MATRNLKSVEDELNARDAAIRTELVEWRFIPRSRRKGYMTRDFFVSGKRFRHFASGANERGVIRYGYPVEDTGEIA